MRFASTDRTRVVYQHAAEIWLVDGGGEAGLHPEDPNGVYRVEDDGTAVPHRVVIHVTDLTKVIGGVRAAVTQVTVDYEGALPDKSYNGEPNQTAVRQALISKPD